MAELKRNDRVISRVSSNYGLTKGKTYTVTAVSDESVTVMKGDGFPLRLPKWKFFRYFEPLINMSALLSGDMFLQELGLKRIKEPDCDCGAWACSKVIHAHFCKTQEGSC